MTLPRSWCWVALVGLLALAALAVLGPWLRRDDLPRCAIDGLIIDPAYRVRIRDERDQDREFCDVQCALLWLEHPGSTARTIRVTDEISGDEFDAAGAFFVRSSVVTNRTTGNRWHVFRDRADAERHSSESRGPLVEGVERPFGAGRK